MSLFGKIVFTIILLISALFFFKYGGDWNLFYADALGYYSYLPSSFIYHNYDSIEYLPSDKNIPQGVIDYFRTFETDTPPASSGNYMNRYTYGVALLQFPFFVVAHIYSYVFDLPTNGYSKIYEDVVRCSSMIYVLLGLYFLFLVLKKSFKKEIALISVCIILIGSNLFWFTFYQVGMSHSYLFFLHSLLLLFTVRFYDKPGIRRIIPLSLVIGIIVITRQPDILFIFIPILYGVYSKDTLKQRITFIKENYQLILFGIIIFCIPILPQIFIWKVYAGNFIYFSYSGQGFDWLKPHIFEGLFGARNGWLLYSPIFIISLAGLFFVKRLKPFIFPSLILLFLFVYVTYSWWCYWYMFGFGSRAMISIYPLLALPLAAMLENIKGRNLAMRGLFFLLISLFVFINLNLTLAAANGRLQSDATTPKFLLNTFYKQNLSYADLVLLDSDEKQPNENSIELKIDLANHQFEKEIDSTHYRFDKVLDSKVCSFMNGEEYAPQKFESKILKKVDGDYLKVEADILIPVFVDAVYAQPKLALSIKRNDSVLVWKAISINNKIGCGEAYCQHSELKLKHRHENKWGRVFFYIDISDWDLIKGDVVESGIWNIPKKELSFDNLSVSIWTKK